MKTTRDDTRELLIGAATKLFSRKGLDGTTVKDLAREAGVNVSLVSYYFGGKEGLYLACLETFGSERLAVAEQILQPPGTAEEMRLRLGLFARSILDFHASHADVARMIMRECESEASLTQPVFERTFLKIFLMLETFFRASQKARILRKEVEPQALAIFIIGAIHQVAHSDFLNKKYFNQSVSDPRYRAKITEQFLQIHVDGILASPAAPSSRRKKS
ncbi:MAG: TetR family transcriptional regulator [Oligoflexia bacterium]|nr:TetR family transcriptional regulator [Oligoflexia bacterium]